MKEPHAERTTCWKNHMLKEPHVERTEVTLEIMITYLLRRRETEEQWKILKCVGSSSLQLQMAAVNLQVKKCPIVNDDAFIFKCVIK